MSDQKTLSHQLIKLGIEIGPLALFFISNSKWGIFTATGVFMVAIVISFCFSYLLERKIPILALVTAVVVLVFGGLTIFLNDALFIKIKPTIVNLLFAAILLISKSFFNKNFLKFFLQTAFQLNEEGWGKLNSRWAYFFIFLALLNEIVWRTQPETTWVNFKVWGMLPITIIFTAMQVPLINKHKI